MREQAGGEVLPLGRELSGLALFRRRRVGCGLRHLDRAERADLVGNFGFSGVGCPIAPPRNSVSLLQPSGEAISPDSGYIDGPISWPQATVADRKSNLWIANCGSDSVTLFPRGRHEKAVHIPFYQDELHKPFGLAIDHAGNAWVTGTLTSTLAVLDPSGKSLEVIESDGRLSRPMGIAADSHGNIWVANFGFPFDLGNPDGTPAWTEPNRVSQFCGVDTAKCPLFKQEVGAPISPDGTGYTSDVRPGHRMLASLSPCCSFHAQRRCANV